jgi:serine/threonine protein kinase
MKFKPFETAEDPREELRKAVKAVDPNLNPIKKENSAKEVYLVTKSNGGLFILKEAPPGYNEARALKQAKEKEVPGITHMIKDYNNGWILKEYAKGRTFEDYENIHGELPSKGLELYLKLIVGKLHKAGIADLDVHPENTVVTEKSIGLKIIDFDGCSLREDLNQARFNELSQRDFENVRKVFTENQYKPHQTRGPDFNELATFDYLFE